MQKYHFLQQRETVKEKSDYFCSLHFILVGQPEPLLVLLPSHPPTTTPKKTIKYATENLLIQLSILLESTFKCLENIRGSVD